MTLIIRVAPVTGRPAGHRPPLPSSHTLAARRTNSHRVQSYRTNLPSASSPASEADFLTKVKAAWRIFFPEKTSLSPKEEGKKRLRMILVADRCGMSSDSLVGMRESIVKAMTQYVEVEQSEAVEVNMNMDPEMGTIYSVAVPVKRVKPTFRPGKGGEEGFDPDDPEDQFPWGT